MDRSVYPMLLKVYLDSDNDLRQYLLSRDLIRDAAGTDNLFPEEVSERLRLLDEGEFEYPQYSFERGKIYPVVISHLVEANYVCLQANSISNPLDEIEFDINSAHENFMKEMESLRVDIGNGFMCQSALYEPGKLQKVQFLLLPVH